MKLGIISSAWDFTVNTPYEKPLGGTESAIAYFAEEMSNKNHNVVIFNKISAVTTIKNVTHVPINLILEYIKNNSITFDIIIVSCSPLDLFQYKIALNAPTTLYCLWTGHDIDQPASKLLNDKKAIDLVDLFIFVSEWQQKRYIATYHVPYNKTIIMRNGIGKPFEKYLNINIPKINKSLCYCSIPWRGLDVLSLIYPSIKKYDQQTTLNIYSGLNIYNQEEDESYSHKFKPFEDVNFNTGVSQTKLAEVLSKQDILAYTNTFKETSCITVLQAMACGCIIITSDLGALRETSDSIGTFIDINIHNFDVIKYSTKYIDALKNMINMPEDFKNQFRELGKKHIREKYTWSIICDKFISDITEIVNNYKNYMSNTYTKTISEFINCYTNSNFKDALTVVSNISFYPNINDYFIVQLNKGVCLYNTSNSDEAKRLFKLCLELRSDYNINKNIAILELQKGNLNKFIKYARNALCIEYDTELANLLAEKYEMLGYYHESIATYENIIYLDPSNINSHNNLGNLLLLKISQIDDIDDMIKNTYMKALYLSDKLCQPRKKELILSNIIFNNLYNWKLSPQEIYERSCVWYKYFPKLDNLISITNKLNRELYNSKIRVGYISFDFITHPVGFMFDSILKNHDTNSFSIFCYDCCDPTKNSNDATYKKLIGYNNAKWVNIVDKNDAEALEIIVNDDLDILVDMMGHTRNTRMNLLQYKPARVLISYFAYPATNGLKEIDYRLTDIVASPPSSQAYFTEKFYYLPNGFQCYTPPVELDYTKDYTRQEHYTIHLCCFNNPTKLSIPTIDTFCEVLKALPESILFLRYCYYKSSYYKETIYKLFLDRGIPKSRLNISFEPIIDALKLYTKIDIALDPFPYNGGTITSEALYMNTPIITLEGDMYVSRVGASLLTTLGLTKYIAKTKEEYVSKVVELARNKEELHQLHSSIRSRMLNTGLANTKSFTQDIENAYKDIILKKMKD